MLRYGVFHSEVSAQDSHYLVSNKLDYISSLLCDKIPNQNNVGQEALVSWFQGF